ncbi:hypothetical protein NYV49_26255 [Escherichia coli]|nr:hypothetical protein [Escherichia coli]
MKQARRLRADLRTLIRRVTICPDVEPGFLQRLHPFSHSDFRIDVLFDFRVSSAATSRDFSEASSPTAP